MRRMWAPISLQALIIVATLPAIAVMLRSTTTRAAPSPEQGIPTSAITRQENPQRIIKVPEWASAPTWLPPRRCDPQPQLVQMPNAEPRWNSLCCYLAPQTALVAIRTAGRSEVKTIHRAGIVQLAEIDSLWLATWTITADKATKSTEVFIFPKIEMTNGKKLDASMEASSKSKETRKRIICLKSLNLLTPLSSSKSSVKEECRNAILELCKLKESLMSFTSLRWASLASLQTKIKYSQVKTRTLLP